MGEVHLQSEGQDIPLTTQPLPGEGKEVPLTTEPLPTQPDNRPLWQREPPPYVTKPETPEDYQINGQHFEWRVAKAEHNGNQKAAEHNQQRFAEAIEKSGLTPQQWQEAFHPETVASASNSR